MSKKHTHTDVYYATLFGVTPMSIGRWRRGEVVADIGTRKLVQYLYKDKVIDHVPDWLRMGSYEKKNKKD